MSWPVVALIGIVLAFLLGMHLIGAFERRWKMLNATWSEVERDKMAAAVGQTGQVTEMMRQLGIIRPGEQDEP